MTLYRGHEDTFLAFLSGALNPEGHENVSFNAAIDIVHNTSELLQVGVLRVSQY